MWLWRTGLDPHVPIECLGRVQWAHNGRRSSSLLNMSPSLLPSLGGVGVGLGCYGVGGLRGGGGGVAKYRTEDGRAKRCLDVQFL